MAKKSDVLKTPNQKHPREFITVREALRTKRLYYTYVMGFCGAFYGMYMTSVYKLLGEEYNIDDFTLTLAGSLGAVANAASEFICGMMADKVGF